ncbi:hypothetical protein [Acinetobacter sp. B51(2017)]|uniref:hypothetical protein n=1 Tax=Acinetobacter sp. B51(2017) TaxID=2060938 RepID=UPI000F077A09|nr:hypothetical protein [Acinetobacter sp. B51(2017)]
MAEPVVSTAGATVFLKVYGIWIAAVICASLIALVIMLIRMPKSPTEWAVGLICTLVSSFTGGSFLIVYFELHAWVVDPFGVMALGGIFFMSGLPGWAIVRWTTNFIHQRESKTILDVVRELKDAKDELKK